MWVIIPWLMSGSWVIGPRIDSTFVGSPLGFVGGSGGPHWEALSAMLHTKLVAVRARVLKALVFSCRIHLLNLRWSYIYVSHIEHRFFLSFFFFFWLWTRPMISVIPPPATPTPAHRKRRSMETAFVKVKNGVLFPLIRSSVPCWFCWT